MHWTSTGSSWAIFRYLRGKLGQHLARGLRTIIALEGYPYVLRAWALHVGMLCVLSISMRPWAFGEGAHSLDPRSWGHVSTAQLLAALGSELHAVSSPRQGRLQLRFFTVHARASARFWHLAIQMLDATGEQKKPAALGVASPLPSPSSRAPRPRLALRSGRWRSHVFRFGVASRGRARRFHGAERCASAWALRCLGFGLHG